MAGFLFLDRLLLIYYNEYIDWNKEQVTLKRIYVVNGPNMNLLGSREPEKYGNMSLKELESLIRKKTDSAQLSVTFFQSNHEGELIDYMQKIEPESYVVLNPAGLSHTSVSLRDCVAAVGFKAIEVHISNIFAREEFRAKSLLSGVCVGVVSGLGVSGYLLAIDWIINNCQKN